MEQDQPKGLKTATIWLMVSVALFFDALQIAFSWIGLGFLLIPIEYGTFWLWFKFNNVNFFSMKRAKTLGIGALVETATAGIFPAFTAVVARIALTSKIKDTINPNNGKVAGSIEPNVDNRRDGRRAA